MKFSKNILQNSQENICAGVSLLIKLQVFSPQLYENKRLRHSLFPMNFENFLRRPFLEKTHLRATASFQVILGFNFIPSRQAITENQFVNHNLDSIGWYNLIYSKSQWISPISESYYWVKIKNGLKMFTIRFFIHLVVVKDRKSPRHIKLLLYTQNVVFYHFWWQNYYLLKMLMFRCKKRNFCKKYFFQPFQPENIFFEKVFCKKAVLS